MSIKISALQVENVKRVELVELVPSEAGLTIIGGDNRQGKSSVLDAIAVALGGEKLVPSNPIKDGAEKGTIGLTLSNGWTVQRVFTASGTRLKIIDEQGMQGGQKLLDNIIEKLALKIGDFLALDNKAKVKALLEACGIDLQPVKDKIKFALDARTAVSRDVKKLRAVVSAIVTYPEIEPVDVAGLVAKQQEITEQGQQLRNEQEKIDGKYADRERAIKAASAVSEKIQDLMRQIEGLLVQHKEFEAQANAISIDDLTAEETVVRGNIESLLKQHAEITEKIKNSQEDNRKAASNAESKKKREELADLMAEEEELTTQIETLRASIVQMSAQMPMEGLAIDQETEELTYQGKAWDCMSHSDQLIIATSIVQKLNPKCGFVLIDKLESMDMITLQAFGAWLEKNNLQAIATRVSKGDECAVIITDGKVDDSVSFNKAA